ncbi:ribonuclease III [Dothidotthia symphoricarpi CBS 119687]|uniref:Large ribosomal subunit protein mL44 n=1 Tax=Dothidotthia symphoricarpi CBS 119687 TaxID=1392245 RepID=A0A6A6A8T5_9PLEO|nr:ribonuclease III [Dothidotthia symphoricarpi CBS 119687]KAF2127615.1 ribonuclease III [Dothidotthia symphoricarpi CBS 119687]
MKRVPLPRCASQLLARPLPRRPLCPHAAAHFPNNATRRSHGIQARFQSTVAATPDAEALEVEVPATLQQTSTTPPARRKKKLPLEQLPSPHPNAAERSVKLHALRSRLSLPSRFPLPALARTLVHPSADASPAFNNASLSILGRHLLGYYTTEWLLSHYPRLPMEVVFAAVEAYIGPRALATVAREWGIEAAAEPGGEVDPGLLQFKRLKTGEDVPAALKHQVPWKWNVTTTHKIMATDEFGSTNAPSSPHALAKTPVPLEEAAQSFVRALIGALHVHLGSPLVKRFFRDHFLSRHLDISTLFDFRTPTRDLSRLCAREGFESPIARLISETGRLSRHPVFVVGVYSGRDKLGEGAGSSLDEARTRAAAAALKGWYLYKPVEVTVPSSMEGELDTSKWRPNMVDCGEVIT